jgi:hypothetical protein
MTADIADLLAEIRRIGGDVSLVGCDRLKLVAPTALLPELAERVRAAKPMLLAALADTGQESNATEEGGGGVLNLCRNGATAQHPMVDASWDRAVLAPPDWRVRHCEALVHWSSFHPAGEAAHIAWGEIENRWHMQHGERVPHWQCAGCRDPIGGRAALTLADGNRAHLDKLDCLLSFGERWRCEATAGLKAFGLDPPSDCGSS